MKYYAVASGRKIGVFTTYKECLASVKGYKAPVFKSFETRALADAYLREQMAASKGLAVTVFSSVAGLVWNDADCVLLQFDGGSRGNPGLAGSGAVLYGPSAAPSAGRPLLVEGGHVLPRNATNNEAEYAGLIYGLGLAAAKGVKHLVIEGDSLLVVEQVRGAWKTSAPHLQLLHAQVMKLIWGSGFEYVGIRHVYRNMNARADALANEAMDTRSTFTRPAPAAKKPSKSRPTTTDYFGGLDFIV